MTEVNSELSAAKNSNATLTSTVAQKDQELNALKQELERAKPISSPEADDDAPTTFGNHPSIFGINEEFPVPVEKAESLLEIVESLQKKEEEYVNLVINYHQEREQLYLAVQFHQNEALEAKNNVSWFGNDDDDNDGWEWWW